MHVFAPFNNSFLAFFDGNITDSFLTILFLSKTTKKLIRNYKKCEKKRSKQLIQSDIKYFLTIDFLTETTKNCANFVGSLLVLRVLMIFFSYISDFEIPMTELSKSER